MSLHTQVLETARPTVSSVSTKNPTRCRMPQVCNRISLCSELEYSLHVYSRISCLPTRWEEMETSTCTRKILRQGRAFCVGWMVLMFIRWSSGERADMQYTRGVVYSTFFGKLLFTLTVKKVRKLEKAKAYSLFSVSRIMSLSCNPENN